MFDAFWGLLCVSTEATAHWVERVAGVVGISPVCPDDHPPETGWWEASLPLGWEADMGSWLPVRLRSVNWCLKCYWCWWWSACWWSAGWWSACWVVMFTLLVCLGIWCRCRCWSLWWWFSQGPLLIFSAESLKKTSVGAWLTGNDPEEPTMYFTWGPKKRHQSYCSSNINGNFDARS